MPTMIWVCWALGVATGFMVRMIAEELLHPNRPLRADLRLSGDEGEVRE